MLYTPRWHNVRRVAESGPTRGRFSVCGDWYPRLDSNQRTQFRKPQLYPLSYEGRCGDSEQVYSRHCHRNAWSASEVAAFRYQDSSIGERFSL